MTVSELIKELSKVEDENLEVFVEDGLDPSDPTTDFSVTEHVEMVFGNPVVRVTLR